jgi:chorismate mutase
MAIRGIRGATTIEQDTVNEISEATGELLLSIQKNNPGLKPDQIASIIFTVTEDIRSSFPAIAARQAGWAEVPLLCSKEIPVPDSLGLCIRVLIHWNTDVEQNQIQHIYLRKATTLRPDLAENSKRKIL